MAKTYIYALIDPRDNLVFYVGKSNSPSQRMHGKYSVVVANKFNSIRQLGFRVKIQILDTLESDECTVHRSIWKPREQYWILYYRQLGHDLLNKNNGGGGPSEHSEESKQKIRQTTRSDQWRLMRKKVQKKLWENENYRKRLSSTHLQRDQETKDRQGQKISEYWEKSEHKGRLKQIATERMNDPNLRKKTERYPKESLER